MIAKVLDGAALARTLLTELKGRVAAMEAAGVRPGLAAIQIGDTPASRVYVRNKMRACNEVGLHSETHELAANCTQSEVLATLSRLNADPRVHGIIVQLPLPKTLDAMAIVQSIAIEKDVDGFNWRNLGAIMDGCPQLVPCTPLGVMAMLRHAGLALEGRHATVVGRSNIVGKPLALLLLAAGATVTVCHSKTPDLAAHTRVADLVVAAVGKPGLITGGMLKRGAIVVDVGINRLPNGKLAGDVDYAGAAEVAGWITPVPGGVGPMTVAMLISNTIDAAERLGRPPLST